MITAPASPGHGVARDRVLGTSCPARHPRETNTNRGVLISPTTIRPTRRAISWSRPRTRSDVPDRLAGDRGVEPGLALVETEAILDELEIFFYWPRSILGPSEPLRASTRLIMPPQSSRPPEKVS